jgi:hypothetical protein
MLDLDGGRYFSLNEVGAAVWEGLTRGLSLTEVSSELLESYEIDKETLRRDIERIVAELVAEGLLEPRD